MKRYVMKPGSGYTPLGPNNWRRDALCAGDDLELYYGPDGERRPAREARERRAVARCWACPVRTPCLEDALIPAGAGQYGVRGGMTAEERIVERRNRMRRTKAQIGRAA